MTLIASSQLTVVVGLGVSGLAVARFLLRQQVNFVVMDSRTEPPGLADFQRQCPEVALILGGFDRELLLAAEEIILSPGVSLQTPEIAEAATSGVAVIGDIELFARVVDKPVVAITGSNAKTTVTSLLGQMALDAGVRVVIGGNIGEAALDILDAKVELYILELSSFQLETTSSLKPKVATVLNISEDHMDRYDSLVDYHRAKQRIYLGAETVVVNRDDDLTCPPLAQQVKYLSFGAGKPDRHGFGLIEVDGQPHLAYEFSSLMPASELALKGQHNVVNGLSALAIGQAIGLPMTCMLSTLRSFQGLPHRCQWISTLRGVDYINDSKATNVGATLAALQGFAANSTRPNIVLIAGGDGKGADFSPLKSVMQQTLAALIVIGQDAHKIADLIEGRIQPLYAQSLQDAVELAQQHAASGDIVLLSPACSSLDMFRNYQERGDQFIQAVREMAA